MIGQVIIGWFKGCTYHFKIFFVHWPRSKIIIQLLPFCSCFLLSCQETSNIGYCKRMTITLLYDEFCLSNHVKIQINIWTIYKYLQLLWEDYQHVHKYKVDEVDCFLKKTNDKRVATEREHDEISQTKFKEVLIKMLRLVLAHIDKRRHQCS